MPGYETSLHHNPVFHVLLDCFVRSLLYIACIEVDPKSLHQAQGPIVLGAVHLYTDRHGSCMEEIKPSLKQDATNEHDKEKLGNGEEN